MTFSVVQEYEASSASVSFSPHQLFLNVAAIRENASSQGNYRKSPAPHSFAQSEKTDKKTPLPNKKALPGTIPDYARHSTKKRYIDSCTVNEY